MFEEETAIEGWESIAKMFKVHVTTMIKRKDELKEAGAIFYKMAGVPPHKVVCAFPSVLQAWISKKSAKGEFL